MSKKTSDPLPHRVVNFDDRSPVATPVPGSRHVLIGTLVVALGGLALLATFVAAGVAPFVLGVLMLVAAGLQALHGTSLRDRPVARANFLGAVTSAAVGGLLLAWGELVYGALSAFLGLSWVFDGVAKWLALVGGGRSRRASRAAMLFDAVVGLVIGVSVAVGWPFSGAQALFVVVGLRLVSIGTTILFGRDAAAGPEPLDEHLDRHPDPFLRLPPSPVIAGVRAAVEQSEARRWGADRYWLATLLVTFLAIHAGRTQAPWNLVGLFTPAVAVAGDVFFALIVAYVLILPVRLAWRLLTRPLERRAWRRVTARPGEDVRWHDRLLRRWMAGRMRFTLRVAAVRTSPAAALRRGVQVGLPVVAVLIALVPLWGVSWYFDTENWAAGAWDQWASHRADAWRAHMVDAVAADPAARGGASPDALFHVEPPGVTEAGDFAFLVVGDPGEGDASQHVLRDQYLRLGRRDDVKFLVVSSDVIYPQGAMKDYEPKFYLPFKGFAKPVYAIPGNHDWYDALEAFTANFLAPDAARAALRGRRAADNNLTTTTAATVEANVAEAARLRAAYGVAAAGQRAPFFEVQTPDFALLAIDTGILRSVDDRQMAWLRAALGRSRGKFTMAVLGHPFYAAGRYTAAGGDPFDTLHALLREHDVAVTMAGDTHDFEYYREPHDAGSTLHFVNGGGGAYLSIGTALGWPADPPVPECGFYPRTDAVVAKLDAETPFYKRPLWWWVRRAGAWPSTPETLASAFASNRAPFYQSFVEVRVERSRNQVRIVAHGPDGPLTWPDVQAIGPTPASGPASSPQQVEFILPLTPLASDTSLRRTGGSR